jgi:hypothetical protein
MPCSCHSAARGAPRRRPRSVPPVGGRAEPTPSTNGPARSPPIRYPVSPRCLATAATRARCAPRVPTTIRSYHLQCAASPSVYATGRLADPINHQARAVPPTSHAGRRWRPTEGRTAYTSNATQCAERRGSRSLVPVPRALCWAAWREDDCTGGGSDNQTARGGARPTGRREPRG